MEKTNYKEKLAIKVLAENVEFHLGGLENAFLDGDITEEKYNQEQEIQKLFDFATDVLNDAMRSGNMLESPYTNIVIEAKHLKFLGKERLDFIKGMAVAKAIS